MYIHFIDKHAHIYIYMYLHFFKQSLMCPTHIFDSEKEINLVNVLHLKRK